MDANQAPGVSRLRHVSVLLVGLLLVGLGLGLALSAGSPPLELTHVGAFGLLLLPLYLAAARWPLDFEFRRDTVSVSLTQLPLTLGVLLVSPLAHVAMRTVATLVDCVLLRRQPPSKTLYNVACAVFEVGLVARFVGSIDALDRPGPELWLALFVGVLVSELTSQFLLQLVVLPLMGRRPTLTQVMGPLRIAAATATVFTAIAIIAVAAAITDPSTVLLVLVLVVCLGLGYRGYRLQSEREQRTEQMYRFVKNLRPVLPDTAEAYDVLQEVRALLYAGTLDLALQDASDGSWRHVLTRSDGGRPLETVNHVGAAPQLAAAPAARADSRTMAVPLYGQSGLLGVLTVSDRLGSLRGFDIGDLRLLETLAVELSAAFERGRLLADLQRAATIDVVTELPNLEETTRRIGGLIAQGGPVAVMSVGVESFRDVNDTLGHEIGDRMLYEVARRLREAVPGAVLGRLGGGRFAVAMARSAEAVDAAMIGLDLRSRVEGSLQLGAVGTYVRLAVGCVHSPEHGTAASTLLRRAETAMSSAALTGGGPVLWEAAYEVSGQRRLAVVGALREAITMGAIGVAYQPKLDVLTGRVVGVEALARWTHPALGYISPDEFIPLAETAGMMSTLTNSILLQSLTACRGWQRRASDIGVAVNVSADTVLDPGFVTEVAAALESVGLPPELLTLELTESVLLGDTALAVERMRELRALGVLLAVDDFGTGYSSLTYLKGLPVDEVKIDRGFVRDLAREPGDRAVVRAVVDIAHTLGLRVVAEGVELVEQLDLLRLLGVDEVQGYLHARPMPAVGIATWLRTHEATLQS